LVWYRNNKAGEKYSAEDVENILEATYLWLKEHPEIFLKCDVDLYMMETHGIVPTTRSSWMTKIHINNKCIVDLWTAINTTIESRLVQRERGIRGNIQAMVLQNRHGYTDKQEQKVTAGSEIIIRRADFPQQKKEEKE